MATTTRLSELTGDYVLDTARTRIGFAVRQAMVAKVRGQFDEFEGSAHLDGDNPAESSARITIQARSIQTRNQQRDDHLRGHFLDAGNHPAITFTTARVEQAGETSFKVTGDLTIRGVTRPVTIDAEFTGAADDRGAASGPASRVRRPSTARTGASLERRAGGRRRPGRPEGDAGLRRRRDPAVRPRRACRGGRRPPGTFRPLATVLARRAVDCAAPSARSSTDRASDYGSEGWGFESLRARPGQRDHAIRPEVFALVIWPHFSRIGISRSLVNRVGLGVPTAELVSGKLGGVA